MAFENGRRFRLAHHRCPLHGIGENQSHDTFRLVSTETFFFHCVRLIVSALHSVC